MNLVWHIVKKDLRALRWPLLVWVGLIAAKLVTGVMLLTTTTVDDEKLFTALDGLSKMLAGAECLGVVLVAALIQEDLLVGTTAFWMTRPISGRRLLAAKLIGLGIIFGVLPILVTVPWWLACRLSLATMLMAAVETLALHLLVVIIGVVCAVVTDGLGRFFLWTIAFLAAIPLGAGTVAYTLGRLNVRVPADLATTRLVIGIGILVAVIAAVVVHQFLTRRIWRSIGMIVAGILLVMLVELLWPWSWHLKEQWNQYLEKQAKKQWPVDAEPPGLNFVVNSAIIPVRSISLPDRPVKLWVYGRVNGVRANQRMVSGVSNYTLRFKDGTTDEGWSWVSVDNAFRPGLEEPSFPGVNDTGYRVAQTIPASTAARLGGRERVAYTVETRLSLVEAGTPERLPLTPGPRTMFGPVGERIAAVERRGEQLLVTFVRHRPALLSDFLTGISSYVLGSGTGWSAPTAYFLADAAGKPLDGGAGGEIRTTRVAAVEVSWETKAYRAMPAPPNGALSTPRAEAVKALEEAQLSRVTYSSRGSFTHIIQVDSLRVTKQ